MKRIIILSSLFILLGTSQSCFLLINNPDDIEPGEFTSGSYQPVIMKRSVFENTTFLENTPRPIQNSGKIYVQGNYIFINEVNQGFHIIDNTNPSNPLKIGFIQLLGSSDLSIKDHVIYANNATDLVSLTLDEESQTLTLTKRLENVFPQIWSPEGRQYYNLEEDDIIVNWELIN